MADGKAACRICRSTASLIEIEPGLAYCQVHIIEGWRKYEEENGPQGQEDAASEAAHPEGVENA